ncbi:MAG: Twitching mobility protein [Lentisphaerae bacterium ADurb.Bin242]|nr:MAG: Twitching mobility protein [Lentisphaerae bacterium ADurb.Bin242]
MSDPIQSLLKKALSPGISDLFVGANKVPAFRIKGKVVLEDGYPPVPAAVIDEFRRQAVGEKGEKYYEENGTCDASFSFSRSERFRLNFYTTIVGPALAARPVQSGNELDMDQLNLPPILKELCDSPRGLILVAGSTGSGKSTTLGAIINRINQRYEKHILTIEDPIEFLHTNGKSLISQREINSNAVSFVDALRSALRENPDVIVIGEMRDTETMQVAINAALTGHLVVSTVHTADTIQSVERIINMFPEHQREQAAIDLGMALIATLAQRLIPMKDGNKMIPAFEILLGTPTVKKSIADRDYDALEDSLKRGSESGMVTFNRAIFHLFKKNVIVLEDALRAVNNPDEFNLLVKGMESGVDAFRNQYGNGFDVDDGTFVDMRTLLRIAVATGASDLHLTNGSAPILRINGTLRPVDLPVLGSVDIQRLLYSVISPRQRIELEEKRELDFALAVTLDADSTRFTRFRINAFFQRGTLGVVARVVNSVIPTPEELTLPVPLLSLLEKHQGLILITGPTGSGKSTTLACLLNIINHTRNAKIITIEDPIEYVHDNHYSIVEQRELHSDTLSFSSALKYALREDPDVIMVGEMRDVETIAAALTAAETGHLVFATIHTNSAPQTIDRIVDSFPNFQQNQIRLQLASVLLGVVSQRLIPKLDNSGRAAAFEVMIGTPPVQSLIREGKTYQLQSVIETSFKDGMITLEKSLTNLYNAGLVSLESTKVYHADYKQIKEF